MFEIDFGLRILDRKRRSLPADPIRFGLPGGEFLDRAWSRVYHSHVFRLTVEAGGAPKLIDCSNHPNNLNSRLPSKAIRR
jgi:hypothetical protein